MPQLAKKKAKRVEEAEGGQFKLIPLGTYKAMLTDVKQNPGVAADVWWAYFTIDENDGDGEHDGTQLLGFLSLSDKAEWKMKEFFEAFGVSADTHTDKLLRQHIRLAVSIQVAQKGKRMGQEINSIDSFLPLEDDDDDGDDDEPF